MRSTQLYTTRRLYNTMVRILFFCVVVLPMIFAAPVMGASCSYPYTFQNGQVADANQVNADLTALQNCTNAIAAAVGTDPQDNTHIGAWTLMNDSTGHENTSLGLNSLRFNTEGSYNFAGGAYALENNTIGSHNTASGDSTLWKNTTGSNNTASGTNALTSNTTGHDNTASGFEALISNITGYFNVADGVDALYSNTTGNYNTASGYGALESITTSSANTAYGAGALGSLTTGIFNIAIGNGAGINLTNGTHNIYIDHPGQTTESGTIRIGDTHYTQAFVAGIANVPLNGSEVVVTSSGQLGIIASSARYKRDIHDMGERSQGLFQLRPVTFHYKQDAQGQRQYGLIAEEVSKVYPELVVRGAKGEVESVQYHELIPMLLNEVQHQQQELAELKAQNERLQAALAQQNAAVATRLERLEAGATHDPALASRRGHQRREGRYEVRSAQMPNL